ncbi:MAG: hypothetical protein AAB847_01390 [Patescibacteria group bacterium]
MESKYRNNNSIASLDVITNTLMGFITLFLLVFILAAQAKKKEEEKRIDTSGEYIVLVVWDNKSEDDVDTHIRDPQGNQLFYNNREVGLMHLERDDRGKFNDVLEMDFQGIPVLIEKNEERAIIRGIIPGEYIVNVHMFRKVDQSENKVKISLIKLSGQDTIVVEKEVVLKENGDEETAFRFTLGIDGKVGNINQLPRKFVRNVVNQEMTP